MNDLTNIEIEILRDDGEFVAARVERSKELRRCLLICPTLDQPAPSSLAKLKYIYTLQAELDAAWATRPVELVIFRGQLSLLLEDPGGVFLETLIGKPLMVRDVLRMAIGMSKALGGLHASGLIHCDVKPGNFIVDEFTGDAWLTGFGLTSRLARHREPLKPPEDIAGTLAYMAPEQTGRMNRSVDSRSDLYSIGITFYELFVGEMPFAADDPMEWVHCQIAKVPVSPSLRRSEIPKQISAIILKLLSKTPEARYQTAAGLEADLRRCLSTLQTYGQVEAFPLGAGDVPDRLWVPEKLYGREKEVGLLLGAFDRVLSQGTTQVVLVSGYSGVGKSSVVNELHKMLVPPRGIFACGKFDQYKRDIPYATLAQAFRTLVRQILAKCDVEVARWRDCLIEALGTNSQLIVNLIPEIELLIGSSPPVPDLPPQDARNRFQLVLRRFIGVFARSEHPLALFLDDLQWLDAATLELIEHLVVNPEVRHLLLIGAYRDNEVNPGHPLMRTLQEIRARGELAQDIVLSPLQLGDLVSLTADTLHCPPAHSAPLAQVLNDKTKGNPFFCDPIHHGTG